MPDKNNFSPPPYFLGSPVYIDALKKRALIPELKQLPSELIEEAACLYSQRVEETELFCWMQGFDLAAGTVWHPSEEDTAQNEVMENIARCDKAIAHWNEAVKKQLSAEEYAILNRYVILIDENDEGYLRKFRQGYECGVAFLGTPGADEES